MSAQRTTVFLGDFEAPAGWALIIDCLPRSAKAMTGRPIGVFMRNELDSSETLTTSDFTISRHDDTGEFTVTLPAATVAAKVGKRFSGSIGFTDTNDCVGEFTARFYQGGR